jgi:hypothetical protein
MCLFCFELAEHRPSRRRAVFRFFRYDLSVNLLFSALSKVNERRYFGGKHLRCDKVLGDRGLPCVRLQSMNFACGALVLGLASRKVSSANKYFR